jgi:lysyl-tRNA synthetase class 2
MDAYQTKAAVLRLRHTALKAIREFFYGRGYIEVETPHLTKTPPPDPYIDPLAVHVAAAGPYYLHTSPEMGMKKLLAAGHDKIFQVCKVFRVEEFEEHHSIEYTMLEWYMGGTYVEAMEETADVVRYVGAAVGAEGALCPAGAWNVYEVSRLFVEVVGFDPLPLDRDRLLARMGERGFQGLGADDTWEDLFFKLLVQEIEPKMAHRDRGPYFIRDWPASITAMARKKDAHTVERFELYMQGLEIANGYTELLDAGEQRRRFDQDVAARRRSGKPVFPPDDAFLDVLARLRGPVAGVAIGVDRLLMALLGKGRIDEVLTDRFRP